MYKRKIEKVDGVGFGKKIKRIKLITMDLCWSVYKQTIPSDTFVILPLKLLCGRLFVSVCFHHKYFSILASI